MLRACCEDHRPRARARAPRVDPRARNAEAVADHAVVDGHPGGAEDLQPEAPIWRLLVRRRAGLPSAPFSSLAIIC